MTTAAARERLIGDREHDLHDVRRARRLGGTALVGVGTMASSLFQLPPDDLATFRAVLFVVGLQTALNLPMSVVERAAWRGCRRST